jgi:ribosome-binding protein aMBF1 (putative translation factor)
VIEILITRPTEIRHITTSINGSALNVCKDWKKFGDRFRTKSSNSHLSTRLTTNITVKGLEEHNIVMRRWQVLV